jgi:galactoside O-acetyltransferase
MDNIFFDMKDLKYCGQNVIIGKTVRIRYPELVSIDDYSIIDDFTYISTGLELGKYCHIGPNCTIGGGRNALLKMGDFCGIGSNSTIYPGVGDHFGATFDGAGIPAKYRKLDQTIVEGIVFQDHVWLGTHVIVMPGVHLPTGFSSAAATVIRKGHYQPWTLYGGYECKKIIGRWHGQYDEDVRQFLLAIKKDQEGVDSGKTGYCV